MGRTFASLLVFALYTNVLFAGAAGSTEADTQKIQIDLKDQSLDRPIQVVFSNVNRPEFHNDPTFNNHLFINVQSFIKNSAQAFASNRSVQYALQQLKNIPVKQMQSWMYDHPYVTGCIFTLMLYGSLYVYLLRLCKKTESLFWADYKKHITTDGLFTACLNTSHKKDLQQSLIEEIFVRYYSALEPTNRIKPLMQFSNKIEQEIRLLNRYIWLANNISALRFSTLFPINSQKLQVARDRLRRAQFFKDLFIDWSVQQKLHTLASQTYAVSLSES